MMTAPEVMDVSIRFEEHKTRKGLRVQGSYANMPVYRFRGYENVILPGRAYRCNLVMNYCTMGNFFAIPIEEIIEPKLQTVSDEGKAEEEPVISIVRISPSELKSDIFTDEGYQVRISPDGKRMSITPFSRSSNRCKDGILTLKGLDRLIPFKGIQGLEFSQSGDTIKVAV